VSVLVADDDDDIRALVAFTLSRAGFTVVTAQDGRSAFGRLGGEAFQLAVRDINCRTSTASPFAPTSATIRECR